MTKDSCQRHCLAWHLIPIALGVISFGGMIFTYFLAKHNCHIEKWYLPYISYTGTEYPESSVFGLLLNVEGFIGIIIVVLLWRFMRHMNQKTNLNCASVIMGILSCFGVIMVGNFQVTKNKVPHYIGAFLAFIIGTVYCGLTSILTHKFYRSIGKSYHYSMVVCVLRYLMTSIMVLSIAGLTVMGVIRLVYKAFSENSVKSSELATTDTPVIDYPYRFPNGSCVPVINSVPLYKRYLDLAGSCSEWLLTVCLLFSLTLFAYEFKNFEKVKIILKMGESEIDTALVESKHRCSSINNRSDITSISLLNDTSQRSISTIPINCNCTCHTDSLPLTETSENNNKFSIVSENQDRSCSTSVVSTNTCWTEAVWQ